MKLVDFVPGLGVPLSQLIGTVFSCAGADALKKTKKWGPDYLSSLERATYTAADASVQTDFFVPSRAAFEDVLRRAWGPSLGEIPASHY
jgi:hypothetical protein